MKLVKILIAGTAMILMAPVYAAASDWHDNNDDNDCHWNCGWQEPGSSVVVNGQLNLGPVWSKVNTEISNVTNDVNISATAVGNTVSVITMQDTEVDNQQQNLGEVGARIDAGVDTVEGNVVISAQSLCNGADVSTDPRTTIVSNNQHCGAADPSTTINASVTNINGGVGIQGVAVGNQFSADSNAPNFPVSNYQQNDGGVTTDVNAVIANVANGVDVSATAVGNTAQIVHYSTGP